MMTAPTFLYLASLNSGSNGNCYYIGNDQEAILIDAGISCCETERRMAGLGFPIGRVKAIFISHEHGDHTRGAEVLSRKHRIPVYITPATYLNCRLCLDPSLTRPFSAGKPVNVGDLAVHPFSKQHDGIDPHSFIVTWNGITAGVMTDIGVACENVINQFSRCNAVFLETNYDETMLLEGRYPVYLKRRILSERGHLSNDQALEIFTTYRSPHLRLLILSHLSAQNNDPQLVNDLFARYANGTHIAVASRYEASPVFCITG